jgi:hypothetical protein
MHIQWKAERNRSTRMLKAGMTVVDVSKTLNRTRNKIHESAARFKKTDNRRDYPRSSRPRATIHYTIMPLS